jgi:cysteine-rich repeat protein
MKKEAAMSSISRISYFRALIALFFLLCIQTVSAILPSTLSYQAYVTDTIGSPIEGEQSVTFRLYTTQNGASMVWQETQQLTINQGLLQAQLGAVTPLNLPNDFDTPVYLGIEIGADGEMSPRQPLTLNGYAVQALNADTLDGQDAAALDQSAHVNDIANPHGVTPVQIGAATPADIANHASVADEHHARYTNAQAVAAVQAHNGVGVNADTLDGNHASAFAPTAHGHTHNHDTNYYTQPQVDTIVSALQGRIVEAERCPEATFLIGFDEAGKALCSETNPVCGSGKIIDPEQCDDGNLDGGDGCSRRCEVERDYFCFGAPSRCMRTTEMWAQAASALVITELNFGPSTITEYNYQWIELKNTSDRLAFNLQDGGFAVEYTDSSGRPQTKEFPITAPLVVLPGQSVVLSEAPALPEATGIAVSFVWGISSSSFYLPATQEGSVRLMLVDPFGQPLDGIEYVGNAPLLDNNGSIALGPDFYNNGQNDEVALPAWCGSSSMYGSKEIFYGIGTDLQRKVLRFYGSPGSDNAQCP